MLSVFIVAEELEEDSKHIFEIQWISQFQNIPLALRPHEPSKQESGSNSR